MTKTAFRKLSDPTLTETAWERQMYLSGVQKYDLNEFRESPPLTAAGKNCSGK